MAKQIGERPAVTRNTAKPRRQFFPEASAAAAATGEILVAKYGQAEWIEQVVFAVQNAVQNGIEQLSRTSISYNAHPGDEYRFDARTKDQLIQSKDLAANSGGVKAGRKVLDPAKTELGAPEWSDEDQTKIIVPASELPPPPKAKGWLL